MGAALAFWKAIVADKSNFLERVIALLDENDVRYCVIGGVAVNAYAAPVVTQDLDIAVASDQLELTKALLSGAFRVRQFEHSFNVYDPGSALQVQLQMHPDVPDAVERATVRDVMDLPLPVAAPADLMKLKVEAALEPTRRPSKRQKDLADIVRLVEVFPELRAAIPAELMGKLFL